MWHFTGFVIGLVVPGMVVVMGVSALSGAPVAGGQALSESLNQKLAFAFAKHQKLILLGGSSVRYGYSAKYIEETLGIPAVNLATNLGLGRKYLLYYARHAVRNGDLVVLPFEYQLYEKEKPDTVKSIQVLAFDQGFLSSMKFLERLDFLVHVEVLDWVRLALAKFLLVDSPERRPSNSLLNEWGDETHNPRSLARPERVKALQNAFRRSFKLDTQAIEDIVEFGNFALERGARVIVAYPNMLRGALDIEGNAAFLRDIKIILESKGIPVIGTPESVLFNESEIFDSIYHVNNEWQIIGSLRLVRGLEEMGLLHMQALGLTAGD